jgi:predicted RNA-binding Zn ribbon-like protein
MPGSSFRFVGGALCLDFTNTVGNHLSPDPGEKLRCFEDLVDWCRQAAVLSESDAKDILRQGEQERTDASGVLELARDLREAMYRIFGHLDVPPADADLRLLNRVLKDTPLMLQIEKGQETLTTSRQIANTRLISLLGPIAWSAAELLTSDKLQDVKQCDGETCGWLFIDTTKNHRRRWCAMDDCGARAKARAYYRRKKAVSSKR